jgi:microcystin-dependent protein
MGQPYIGEIRMFGGNFAPAGWAFCDGQLMPISENDALFNLIGTTYGGDGQETFALPNLQSRVPLHSGNSAGQGLQQYTIGEMAGVESVTLTTQQIPVHNHAFQASMNGAVDPNPQDQVIASPPTLTMFIVDTPVTPLNQASIQPAGGSQPHENLQPLLVVSFIISLFGIYPTQT